MKEFARGLEELLVIEEKRAFCELFMRDVLYNQAERPRIVGKHDLEGGMLVPPDAELDADRIAQIVAKRLERKLQLPSITARVALLEAMRERPAPLGDAGLGAPLRPESLGLLQLPDRIGWRRDR